jgi:hypothetical protein
VLHDKSLLNLDPALLETIGVIPPDQAERLLAGAFRDERPGEWTPGLVKRRLSDAAGHIERTSRRIGPNRFGRSWIDWRLFRDVDAFDRNCMAEGLRLETRVPDRHRRGGATAAEIRQAEAALEWPLRYLADHDDERAVLSLWIWTEARHLPWEHWCRGAGVSKGTANRRRARAFEIIAAGLARGGVTPE